MSIFLKIVTGSLVAVILWVYISKENTGISVLLSLSICIMIIIASVQFLDPIIIFIQHLKVIGNTNEELFDIMLKAVGIGLITEISSVICKDAGNESLAKSLQLFSSIIIIRISIPIFENMISLLDEILGTI